MPRKQQTATRRKRTKSATQPATDSPLAGGFATMFAAPSSRDPMDPARPGSLKLSQWFGMKDCPHCAGIGRVPTTKEDLAPNKPAA